MVDWEPISESALYSRLQQGQARMTPHQQRLWSAVRIQPEKWHQHPYGDSGSGFWAVGLVGNTVLWYNDLVDGFNRSQYTVYGTIDDYLCNEDELESCVEYLWIVFERGVDLARLVRDVPKVNRQKEGEKK